MRINKKSWHYRLASAEGSPKANLCGYFWQVMWALFLILLFLFFLICMITCFFTSNEQIRIIGYLSWIACVIVGSMLGLGYLSSIDFFKRKPKSPGILSAYLKAKKEKVCPKIEFYEDIPKSN